jgi:hypothetical protein
MGEAHPTDETGKMLKSMVLVAWGYFPLMEISERHEDEGMHDIYGSECLTIDTEQFDLIDDFALRYVEHLVEEAIKAKLRDGSITKSYHSTDRKYSFSDSMDWWKDMMVEDGDPRLGQRPIFYLDIQLP